MNDGANLQRWAAIATILGLIIAFLALFRDTFDYRYSLTASAEIGASQVSTQSVSPPASSRPPAPPVTTAYVPPTQPSASPRPPQIIELTRYATASASSKLPPEPTVSFGLVSFDPSNALDRNAATSWVEGADGPGIGEYLKLDFPQSVTVARLGFDIGFDRDEQIFAANNRVHRVRLVY